MKLGENILSSMTKNPLNFEGDPDIRPDIRSDVRLYQLNKYARIYMKFCVNLKGDIINLITKFEDDLNIQPDIRISIRPDIRISIRPDIWIIKYTHRRKK